MLRRVVLLVLALAAALGSAGLALVLSAGPAAADDTAGTTACEHASAAALEHSHVLAARCAATPTSYVVTVSYVLPPNTTTRVALNCADGSDTISRVEPFKLDPGVMFYGFSAVPTSGDELSGWTFDPAVNNTPTARATLSATIGTGEAGGSSTATFTCQVVA
jgi:hypothetical protein